MKRKKVKSLVLKKETIMNLSGFEQNRVKGGDFLEYVHQYVTGMESNRDPAICAINFAASEVSFCYCTNGQNTCNCPLDACTYTCHTAYDGGEATNCAPCLTN
jgi:hypothetical protein